MGDMTAIHHQQENSRQNLDFLVLDVDTLCLPPIKTTTTNNNCNEEMDPFADSRLHVSSSKFSQPFVKIFRSSWFDILVLQTSLSRKGGRGMEWKTSCDGTFKGLIFPFSFCNYIIVHRNSQSAAVLQSFRQRQIPASFRRCKIPAPPSSRLYNNRGIRDGWDHHLPGYILEKSCYSSLACKYRVACLVFTIIPFEKQIIMQLQHGNNHTALFDTVTLGRIDGGDVSVPGPSQYPNI